MSVELMLFVLRLVFIFALYFFIVLVARVLTRELTVRNVPERDTRGCRRRCRVVHWCIRRRPRATPGQAYLVIVDGASTGIYVGTVYPIGSGVLVGRAPTVDVPLPDVYTSSEHARFLYDRDRWTMEDLKSMNGSYVNGQRVAGIAPLGDGDTVQLGRDRDAVPAPPTCMSTCVRVRHHVLQPCTFRY